MAIWRDARAAVSRSMTDQTANIDCFQPLRAECGGEHPTGFALSAPVKFVRLPARRQINLLRGSRLRQGKSAEKKAKCRKGERLLKATLDPLEAAVTRQRTRLTKRCLGLSSHLR